MEIHKYYSVMKCKWIKDKSAISCINGTLMSEKLMLRNMETLLYTTRCRSYTHT